MINRKEREFTIEETKIEIKGIIIIIIMIIIIIITLTLSKLQYKSFYNFCWNYFLLPSSHSKIKKKEEEERWKRISQMEKELEKEYVFH